MVSGAEKLKLVRELGLIRKNMAGVTAGHNKLKLVKRINEIRAALSVKGLSNELTVDVGSLTAYVSKGYPNVPNDLKLAESIAVKSIAKLKKLTVPELTIPLPDSKTIDHFTAIGNVFASEQAVVSDIAARVNVLRSEAVGPITAERVAQMEELNNTLDDIKNEVLALREEQKLTLANPDTSKYVRVTALIDLKTAQYNTLRDDFDKLSRSNYTERENKIKAERANFIPIGERVIDSLLKASSITEEQATAWASSQIIDKNSATKLKKQGYPIEKFRNDVAEFYKITGGKLRKIDFISDGSKRANAQGIEDFEGNAIAITGEFSKETLWHELAHHLESDPIAKLTANEFLIKRRESDEVHSLRSLTGNKGYGPNEVAYKDGFINPYVGKVYRDGVTEVFSMGVQYLSSPELAATLLAHDPEMFEMITGYIVSDLTPAAKALINARNGSATESSDKRQKIEIDFEQAVVKLAADVVLEPSNWFESLNEYEREYFKKYFIVDPTAVLIGQYREHVIFQGKFKNLSTKRMCKCYGVTKVRDNGSTSIGFIYGAPVELDVLKALLKLTYDKYYGSFQKALYDVVFYEKKPIMIEAANEL